MVQGINRNVNQYYTYILVYVDTIIIMDKDPNKFMYMLMENYTVDTSSIGDTNI